MVLPEEHIENKQLWNGLRLGDTQCFENLFRKFYSEMFYYGLKIFPHPEVVKEAVQETFIRIWESRERLAEAENVKAYLLVSLRRKILTSKDRDNGNQQVDIVKADQYSFLYELNEFEKHQEISNELRQVLLHAVNALTKRQREIIQLFFYHELSYPEIAGMMNMSVQATRNLMCRTLSHLRLVLGEDSIQNMKNIFTLFFLSNSGKKS